ncbi:MAG: hypothetical protein JNN13_05490 [Planctomycetes bacterium]|nr:hypothetical protein [Planctomycetota bacterium]
MNEWMFSLFFAALLVGYVLVHLRLLRFEEHLQKLAGIRGLDDRLRSLDDRLRQLAESMDKVRLDRVEGQLARLHDDLEDLREATTDVRHAVVQIPQPVLAAPSEAAVVTVAPTAETAGERLIGVVERRLLQLGYREVQILSRLDEARLEQDLEVQVECELGGMPVKGRVRVRNGAVLDVALQTVAQMFP